MVMKSEAERAISIQYVYIKEIIKEMENHLDIFINHSGNERVEALSSKIKASGEVV